VASVMRVGGCERGTESRPFERSGTRELELFAELEVAARREIHARVRQRGVTVATTLALGLEVRAVLAAEAEREGARFVAEPGVDERFHWNGCAG